MPSNTLGGGGWPLLVLQNLAGINIFCVQSIDHLPFLAAKAAYFYLMFSACLLTLSCFIFNLGVLLLNAVLTVRAHQANSHKEKGWEQFTDAVVSWLNSNLDGVVFMLWGAYAQRKGSSIDRVSAPLLFHSSGSDTSLDSGEKAGSWSVWYAAWNLILSLDYGLMQHPLEYIVLKGYSGTAELGLLEDGLRFGQCFC